VAGYQWPLGVAQFNGGQSNPAYRLTTPTARYVLREARVLSVLSPADVPVPRVLGICSDPLVLGSEFFVVDMVDGRIFRDATFSDIPKAQRNAYFDAMNIAISAMHSLEPDTISLGDYGRAGNYFERQIGRWSR